MAQKWRTGSHGTVCIPGKSTSRPCPLALEGAEGASPDGLQEISAHLVNMTNVRLYIAGNCNIRFDKDFQGVLDPKYEEGYRQPVFARLPWVIWVFPEGWDTSKTITPLEYKEMKLMGYSEWAVKHQTWAEENLWNTSKFAPKKKPKPKPKRTMRRLEID